MARVRSADGTALNVLTDGDPANPALVFLHGFAQSAAAWELVVASFHDEFFIVRVDLRGHGDSERPLDPAAYTESQRWADDVAAVIAGLELRGPILVGWSYAGCVIADYLAAYGAGAIAGIALVGAISLLGVPKASALADPALRPIWRAVLDPDDAVALAGFRRLTRAMFDEPPPEALVEAWARTNLRLPAVARRAMLARTLDSTATWRAFRKPALVQHGASDRVVLSESALWHTDQMPQAGYFGYDLAGHVPFLEHHSRVRFSRDLRQFASRAFGTVSR
jgi:pimeloyl-ACP methyl ester carboxylesterase